MRLLATLMLVLAFALVRPLAGLAEPCMNTPAVADAPQALDMPCHEMMGAMDHAPEKPAPAKSTQHAGCASACCAAPAMTPTGADLPLLMIHHGVLLAAAAAPAATPVPHAPDLRPPIA